MANALRVGTSGAFAMLALAACSQPGAGVPGDSEDRRPFSEIAEDAVLHFTGTEPFWGGQAAAGQLTYTTPENPDGTTIPVTRFSGRGGMSLSGTLAGVAFDMTVTPGECSDGMSDRSYPFSVTLALGAETRSGCGWSDAEPFEEGPGGAP